MLLKRQDKYQIDYCNSMLRTAISVPKLTF